MFRAIAGYFFGGVEEEANPSTVECETREVKDWLVVNMADRPEDDIDMLDDAIEVSMLTDAEYDEILDAVSCLMRPDELEIVATVLPTNDDDDPQEDMDSQTWTHSDHSISDVDDDDNMSLSSDSDNNNNVDDDSDECDLANFDPLYMRLDIRHRDFNLAREVVQDFRVDDDRTYYLARNKPAYHRAAVRPSRTTDCSSLQDFGESVKVVCREARVVLPPRVVRIGDARPPTLLDPDTLEFRTTPRMMCLDEIRQLVNCYPRTQELLKKIKDIRYPLKVEEPTGTCHSMYWKTYVNHRNPSVPPKSDLLQKIKELEVEQQAQEYKMKKFISKGQINRQNKNCMFESSCKKNRRRNLQRNPSGANNNRKC